MRSGISATRLTLYGFISCIELDLRSFILDNLHEENYKLILDYELISKLLSRSEQNDCNAENYFDLIEYFDFGDCVCVINRFKKIYPKSLHESIDLLTSSVEQLISTRNRVMHNRPLEINDLPLVIDFIEEFIIKTKQNDTLVDWFETNKIRKKINEQPEYIFGIKLPKFTDFNEERVLHNLPPAEFDDTGFIGRNDERRNITNSIINGTYPVISIIGDGGIGKTALVVRCAYDILDRDDNPFDAIVWVSLKTTVFNNGEFNNINHTITNTLEIFQEVDNILIGTGSDDDESLLREIFQYMNTFKVLLILDNLETINTDQVRNFFKEIPKNSRVLVTSRIGIGEFENREMLEGFSKKERVYYLRMLAKYYNVSEQFNMSDEKLDEKICQRLHSNPLAMKWFTINVCKGEPINSILSQTQSLTNYCMSNVYDKLSKDAKGILEIMLIINKNCSDAELNFLSGLDNIQHRKSINELVTTNMVKMRSDTKSSEISTLFYISDFAKEYLKHNFKPDSKKYLAINTKFNQMRGMFEDALRNSNHNPYDPKSIIAKTQDEKIANYYLRKALLSSKDGDFSEAFSLINLAKNAVPNYYEIYKISAFIHAANKDFFAADNDYTTALNCKRSYAPLLYLYAGFKLSCLSDSETAYAYCLEAEKLDPNSRVILLQKSRILKQLHQNEEADKLFNKLLESDDYVDKKTTKILIDQSANNLRDWAENMIMAKSYEKAILLLNKAILLMETNQKYIDTKMLNTISKILSTALHSYGETDETQKNSIKLIQRILNQFHTKLLTTHYYHKTQEYFEQFFNRLPIEKKHQLSIYLNNNHLDSYSLESGYSIGVISSLKNGFGFIKSRNAANGVFFHSGECMCDFINLRVGDQVTFKLSKTEKGYSALNLNVINI